MNTEVTVETNQKKQDVLIATLVKKGSPDKIEFNVDAMDSGDKWFINCKKKTKKTNNVKESALFVRKDFYHWMQYYTGILGWTLESIDPEFGKYLD